MDPNPFAPPKTTDLEPREPAGDDGGPLDPAAVAALKGAGRWAPWTAALNALWTAVAGFKVATGRVPGFSGLRLGLVSLALPVSLYVAWLTWRFASAARAASSEGASLERIARRQHQLYVAYALFTFVLFGSFIAASVLKGSGESP